MLKKLLITYFKGDILIRIHADRNIPLILYIFALIALFITINLGVEKSMSTKVDNERIIENLKIDYTHKSLDLTSMDIRSGVDRMLKGNRSKLQAPATAPRRIE